MALFFLIIVIQIIFMPATTRRTYAAHTSGEQQALHLRSSGQSFSPPEETPAQEAQHLQLPNKGPSVTSAEVLPSGEQTSRENAAPSHHVSTEGDSPHVDNGWAVSQGAGNSEQGAAGPANISLFLESEVPSLRSTSTEPTTFWCITHTGEAIQLRFHGIVVRTRKRVYMDMERVDSGNREVLYGIFCSDPRRGLEEELTQAYEIKRAALGDVKWQKSLFPEELPGDILFKNYGLVVPNYSCRLPLSTECIELGDASKPLTLLNLFVSMPPAITPLQSMDMSKLSSDTIVTLCVEMTRRVATLHRFGVVHRKISLRSFFVSPGSGASSGDGGFKGDKLLLSLGDFSSAQPFTGCAQLYSRVAPLKALDPTQARTTFSPVRHKLTMVVTKAQDSWALGMAIYSLICNGRVDPYHLFTPVASELVLLRRIFRLTEGPQQVNFSGCLPLTAHAGILWLRDLVVRFLDPNEATRLLPENALSTYPQLFGDS